MKYMKTEPEELIILKIPQSVKKQIERAAYERRMTKKALILTALRNEGVFEEQRKT